MWLTAVQTESYYSVKTPSKRRERARELSMNLITSATTKETEKSWMHLLHSVTGQREDGAVEILMIDQLCQLLLRIPTQGEHLATIRCRAISLLEQSKFTDKQVIYDLLSDIETWIQSNEGILLKLPTDRGDTKSVLIGYEESKGPAADTTAKQVRTSVTNTTAEESKITVATVTKATQQREDENFMTTYLQTMKTAMVKDYPLVAKVIKLPPPGNDLKGVRYNQSWSITNVNDQMTHEKFIHMILQKFKTAASTYENMWNTIITINFVYSNYADITEITELHDGRQGPFGYDTVLKALGSKPQNAEQEAAMSMLHYQLYLFTRTASTKDTDFLLMQLNALQLRYLDGSDLHFGLRELHRLLDETEMVQGWSEEQRKNHQEALIKKLKFSAELGPLETYFHDRSQIARQAGVQTDITLWMDRRQRGPKELLKQLEEATKDEIERQLKRRQDEGKEISANERHRITYNARMMKAKDIQNNAVDKRKRESYGTTWTPKPIELPKDRDAETAHRAHEVELAMFFNYLSKPVDKDAKSAAKPSSRNASPTTTRPGTPSVGSPSGGGKAGNSTNGGSISGGGGTSKVTNHNINITNGGLPPFSFSQVQAEERAQLAQIEENEREERLAEHGREVMSAKEAARTVNSAKRQGKLLSTEGALEQLYKDFSGTHAMGSTQRCHVAAVLPHDVAYAQQCLHCRQPLLSLSRNGPVDPLKKSLGCNSNKCAVIKFFTTKTGRLAAAMDEASLATQISSVEHLRLIVMDMTTEGALKYNDPHVVDIKAKMAAASHRYNQLRGNKRILPGDEIPKDLDFTIDTYQQRTHTLQAELEKAQDAARERHEKKIADRTSRHAAYQTRNQKFVIATVGVTDENQQMGWNPGKQPRRRPIIAETAAGTAEKTIQGATIQENRFILLTQDGDGNEEDSEEATVATVTPANTNKVTFAPPPSKNGDQDQDRRSIKDLTGEELHTSKLFPPFREYAQTPKSAEERKKFVTIGNLPARLDGRIDPTL
jgi:uncharacterized membrane protein YgcG